MQLLLNKFLLIVIAIDIFAFGLLVIFLINSRINILRKVNQARLFIRVLETSKSANSSEEAAQILGISREKFIQYSKERNIEFPEIRKEREEKNKKMEEEEQKRIMDEEARWRAEQEKTSAERKQILEEQARKRKDRLSKFGFR